MKNTNQISFSRLVFPALVIVFLVSALPLFSQSGVYRTLNGNDFFTLLEERSDENRAVLIDVRTPGEVAEGAAPGSLNIDFYSPDFKNRIENLDRNEAYFLYCRSGNRSGQTLRFMKNLGFSEVYDLSGGWSRYADRLAELEVE